MTHVTASNIQVEKGYSAKVIPNAIQIRTVQGKKVLTAEMPLNIQLAFSFVNRDHALTEMESLWLQHRNHHVKELSPATQVTMPSILTSLEKYFGLTLSLTLQ